MKRKGLIITTIIFFLTVNTNYFWVGGLGLFNFSAFLLLVFGYFALAASLVGQLFFAIREEFTDKQRLVSITVLIVVLSLTFFFPRGLINFDSLEGNNLFIAQREGAANCVTIFKLKKNNKFIEQKVCFGLTEIRGDYTLKSDTIFFTNVQLGRHEDEYYKFAIIQLANSRNTTILGDLVRYKSYSDTTRDALRITKNDLTNENNKK